MTMTVRHNGIEYTNLISGQVRCSIGAISGEFTFTSSANSGQRMPVKDGDSIQILIDGTPVVTGYVDGIQGNYDAKSHSLTVTGRDKTADLVDSKVKGNKEYNKGISFPSIIQSILSNHGITGISVKNNVGVIPSFTDSSSAQIGETIFSFIETLSRKVQVLLTTDGLGNVVITRGSSASSGIRLVHLINDIKKLNNVKSSNFRVDSSDRFNTYEAHAQGNPLFGLSEDSPAQLVGVIGTAKDNSVRAGRYEVFFAEESLTASEAKQRAIWEANIRRAKSFNYSATVQGHSINGKLWTFNQVVNVVDEFWDISADLLISGLTYHYGPGGSTTDLDLTYPDAYTLQANLDMLKKRSQKLGEKFTI